MGGSFFQNNYGCGVVTRVGQRQVQRADAEFSGPFFRPAGQHKFRPAQGVVTYGDVVRADSLREAGPQSLDRGFLGRETCRDMGDAAGRMQRAGNALAFRFR